MPDVSAIASGGKSHLMRNLGLALSSGLLLGLSFPPSPVYTLAYVGFIPFILLADRLDRLPDTFAYSYLTMFVFNLVTLYWVGGFTHGRDPYLMLSGSALLLFHPVLSAIPLMLFFFVRRKAGKIVALLSLPFLWVSWEYVHSLGELSFPWITLGNSQAYDLARSQIAEFSSVYGISFLLLVFNVVAYVLLIQTGTRRWKLTSPHSAAMLFLLLTLYIAPSWYGQWAIASLESNSPATIRVGVVQPNIDPWEKWGEGFASKWESYENQLNLHFENTRILTQDSLDLVVWPETAIPFHILLPQNHEYLFRVQRLVDSLGVALFSGIPHAEYFSAEKAPVTAQETRNPDLYVDSYNSATLFSPNQPPADVYKKMVLVPFAERVPYAEHVPFLIKPLKWSVGISGWGKGAEQMVYTLNLAEGRSARFSGMICYESVYPAFVRSFTEQGAEFLLVITNDSWWGNTSGAYQHIGMASFRAIENRRWIVHCANGGISAFVDPVGRIHQPTSMYTAARIWGMIEARSDKTFYVRHGDLFAQFCFVISFGVLLLTTMRRRRL